MDYFDLHCDTLYECLMQNVSFKRNRLAVSIAAGRKFSRWCQTLAIWIPDGLAPGKSYSLFREVLEKGRREWEKEKREVTLCVSAAGMENALLQGRSPLFLSVEGGTVLEGKLSNVARLHRAGVRMLTLTWNGQNALAGGCLSEGELTSFGRQVIEEMNRLSMMVDLAHLNDKSFWAALPLCRYPLASHTGSRRVNRHPRNLTDEQFLGICRQGGIVGLSFYPVFLGEGDVFEQFYRHLYHFLELGGREHLAVGSDFDGADMAPALSSLDKAPRLWEYLLSKDLDEGLLRKIFWENGANFYTKVLTKSPR